MRRRAVGLCAHDLEVGGAEGARGAGRRPRRAPRVQRTAREAHLYPAAALRAAGAQTIPADGRPRPGHGRRRVDGVAPRARAPAGPSLLHALLRRAPSPRWRRGKGVLGRAQAAIVARGRGAGLFGAAPVTAVDTTGIERGDWIAHIQPREKPILCSYDRLASCRTRQATRSLRCRSPRDENGAGG